MRDLRITQINFHPASNQDRRAGLWGWSSIEIDDALRLDGIAIRKTAAGAWRLAFPKHRDRQGIAHPLVKPLSPVARHAIEAQVIGQLRRQGVLE